MRLVLLFPVPYQLVSLVIQFMLITIHLYSLLLLPLPLLLKNPLLSKHPMQSKKLLLMLKNEKPKLDLRLVLTIMEILGMDIEPMDAEMYMELLYHALADKM